MRVLDRAWLKKVGRGARTRAQMRGFLTVPNVSDVLDLLLEQLGDEDSLVVWGAVDTIYHLVDEYNLCDYVYQDHEDEDEYDEDDDDGDDDDEDTDPALRHIQPQAGSQAAQVDDSIVRREFGEQAVELVAELVNCSEEYGLDEQMLKVRQELIEWMSFGDFKRKLVHRLIGIAGCNPEDALRQYAADLCSLYCDKFFFHSEDALHIEAHINSAITSGEPQPGVVMALQDAALNCDGGQEE